MLKIRKKNKKKDTLCRTIRFDGSEYDKIIEIAYKYNTTFNDIVNQLVHYALRKYDESNE